MGHSITAKWTLSTGQDEGGGVCFCPRSAKVIKTVHVGGMAQKMAKFFPSNC